MASSHLQFEATRIKAMTQHLPQTIRQLEGLPTSPPNLDGAVLVVIDAQHEYLDGRLPLEGLQPALANIERLLTSARQSGSTIVHVVHQGDTGGLFDTASGGRILAQALPVGDEPIVYKTAPNAFTAELRALITAANDLPVVICGFMTHMCVSATARAALDAGLDATVVSDACATRSLPSATSGAAISAATIHESALSELADLFAIVVDTNQMLGQGPRPQE